MKSWTDYEIMLADKIEPALKITQETPLPFDYADHTVIQAGSGELISKPFL